MTLSLERRFESRGAFRKRALEFSDCAKRKPRAGFRQLNCILRRERSVSGSDA
jgi:hypothetical protein